MSLQSYGLQQTMYKAENAQMFQNQFVIQDRGAREHNSRQVQAENEQKMQEVAESEELNNEDAARVDTESPGSGSGTGSGQRLAGEGGEEESEQNGSSERELNGKGVQVDIQA